MDGFGITSNEKGNAIKKAKTPFLDETFQKYPTVQIGASGEDVGLPDGQMGNSEVGHTNMGAGRIVYQELTRITKAIKDGSFFENKVLNENMDKIIEKNKSLHLMGLLSNGGVHSHNTHLYALLELAKRKGISKVYVHAILDGRDVLPESGKGFIKELEAKMKEIGVGKIATVMGRYYAMDRDNRWDRVKKAYDAMVLQEGVQSSDPQDAVQKSYASEVTDEFVVPVVIDGGQAVEEDDLVVFYNFRPDRAREITKSFVLEDFDGFDRAKGYFHVNYVCMTQYDATLPNVSIAFAPQSLKNTFGQYISDKGLTQLRIAETEKYAHVTFFFNGGVEKEYPGEERILVHSPKVATYDLQPEMSAYEVTEKVEESVRSGKFDVIILNFANCDMVGHTGVFDAAVKAVETVDTCAQRVVKAVMDMDGVVFITADHGNADKLLDEKGDVFTAHTTNPVPFCVVGKECELRDGGRLADIAPTMLEILGLHQPEEMDGKSLIR